jgi:hypothetical protein
MALAAAESLASLAAWPAVAGWFHQGFTAAELHQLLLALVRRDPAAASRLRLPRASGPWEVPMVLAVCAI